MTLHRDMSVSDIVLEHPECARVLLAIGVDLDASGAVPFAAACAALRADPIRVYAAVTRAASERAAEWPERDWESASTPAVIAHIIEHHHRYLRAVAPAIRAMSERVARRDGEHDLGVAAQEFFDTLDAHLEHEERSLFPALLVHGDRPANAVLCRELVVSQADHLEIGRSTDRLRAFTLGPSPPRPSTTRRVLVHELEHLERDMKLHVYLENEVLTPRFFRAGERCGTSI